MSIIVGIVLLAAGITVSVFRKKIGKIYDGMTYLTDAQRDHYKNFVLRFVGIVFIITGLLLCFIVLLNENDRQSLVRFLREYGGIFEISAGGVFIALAATIAILRLMKKDEHLMKLGPMKKIYGKKAGSIRHVIGYIVIPFIVGSILLISGIAAVFSGV